MTRAVSRPMPELAPVTMARLPPRSMPSMTSLAVESAPKRRFNGHNSETSEPAVKPGSSASARPPGSRCPSQVSQMTPGAAPPGAAGTASSTPVRSRPPRAGRRGPARPCAGRPSPTGRGRCRCWSASRATGCRGRGRSATPPEAAPASSRIRRFTSRPTMLRPSPPTPTAAPRARSPLVNAPNSRRLTLRRRGAGGRGLARPHPELGLCRWRQNICFFAERSSM